MTQTNRIGMGGEDDRDRRGGAPGGLGLSRRARKNDVETHLNQVGGRPIQLFDRIRPAKFDDKGLALDITEIAQTCPQRLDAIRPSRRRTQRQKTESRNFCCWLRPGAKR